MSDWQPGDLALCVRSAAQTRRGAIYTVRHVGVGMGELRLWFAEWWHNELHRDVGSRAVRFVKIRPHTPDAEDIETIRLLNGKPVPVEAA